MKHIRVPGIHEAREGELVNLIIHDRGEDGSMTITSLYSPTSGEIAQALKDHNLPIDYTMAVIEERNSESHTVLIDLEKYLEHLKEKGYRL